MRRRSFRLPPDFFRRPSLPPKAPSKRRRLHPVLCRFVLPRRPVPPPLLLLPPPATSVASRKKVGVNELELRGGDSGVDV